MTPSQEQTERVKFEAHMSENGKWLKAITKAPDGSYLMMVTALSWTVWLARAAPDRPLSVEESILALTNALMESKGWMRDYADSILRDAIDRTALSGDTKGEMPCVNSA